VIDLHAVLNHLWQSTVFAAACGLINLVMRQNSARVRYGLWLAASVKFLLPLSLLITLGAHLPRPSQVLIPPQKTVHLAFQAANVPFPSMAFPSQTPGDVHSSAVAVGSFSRMFFLLWAAGACFVIQNWYLRWRQLRTTLRSAWLVEQGPEVEILRRLEREAKRSKSIPVMRSQSMMQPGIFGIFNPMMIWPETLGFRLTERQIEAVVAHELAHVRRYDNLVALMHMLVEAVFWFHPMVWWIESRLVEEREHACDEAAILQVGSADVYAESLLIACRVCLESPLPCFPGVAGGNLRRRVLRITGSRLVRKLDLKRVALLCIVGFMSLALPLLMGAAHASPTQFSILSTHSEQVQSTADSARDIAGTWQGTVHDWNDLRIVVVISRMGNGGYSAVYYVIDTGGRGPVDLITFKGDAVKLENHGIGSYEGRLSQDGKSIVGTWNLGIGPGPVPLSLVRATPDTAWRIPAPPPQLAQMAAGANPVFEVATIKPSKPDEIRMIISTRGRSFSTINISLIDLIKYAYDVHPTQIVDAPDWAESYKYDVTAVPDGEGEPSEKQWKLMCRKLLVDRFSLAIHPDKKKISAYVLSVAKSGPKLTKSEQDQTTPSSVLMQGLGAVSFKNADMRDLAGFLQQFVLDRPTVDQTGILGKWDFALKWSPDSSQFASLGVNVPEADSPDAPPKLYTAIREQLGLELSAEKTLTEVLVVDHVQKPSSN
jgi:uncharacterized protein (TIGR03435 family)